MTESAGLQPVRAPWLLKGRAYVLAYLGSGPRPDEEKFLPESLQGRRTGGLRLLMLVDYLQSPVGPYREILFIPGRFPFADGRHRYSISRIFVSSMQSVVSGRANWGIPKDQADFDFRYDVGPRTDALQVSRQGKVFADLRLSYASLRLPVSGSLIPRAIRTLGQHHDGKTYIYAPEARGWLNPARVIRSAFDPAVFPDPGRGRLLACCRVQPFRMTFPVARVLDKL